MPYKSLDEANLSIRGIRPRVTLEQANEIARIADEIAATNLSEAWAIAISNFKRRLYVVRGGRWVKRQKQSGAHEVAQELYPGEGKRHRETPSFPPFPDGVPLAEAATYKTKCQALIRDMATIMADRTLPPAMRIALGHIQAELKKTWADLAQGVSEMEITEVMKTIDGKDYPASDFLVVEDDTAPNTWHLQVKRNGTPDHGLMGGAWAALHGGYRGNKYEGAGKTAAIAKLKALYKDEETTTPAESAVAEHGDMPMVAMPTFGARTFADLDAAHNVSETIEEAQKRTGQLQTLIFNIIADETIADKVAAIKTVADEFVALIGELFVAPTKQPPSETAELSAPVPRKGEVQFAESESGTALALIEENAVTGDGMRAPVTVDFVMIQPGAGNKKDAHWYPADVLKRDAHVFAGADIFATDHIDSQRSERTKVGKVKSIEGFTPSGAPIARAILFDPDTAEKTRNRAKVNELATLECSILGQGTVKPGKIEGIDYKIVETLTRGIALELVSKAGAGGHALNIAESIGGVALDELNQTPATTAVANTTNTATPQPVVIQENQTLPAVATPAPPALLAEAEVKRVLAETKLPQVAQEWILESTYADEKVLKEAIARTTERVKKLTGSGAPFAQGATQAASTQISETDYQTRLAAIDERYGLKH